MQLKSTPQCPTFGGTGRTSGRTQNKNVQPSGNPLKNELNNSVVPGTPVWISIREGRTLLGVTERQIRRLIQSGKYTAQTVVGNGGKQYQILLSSLPQTAQVKYWSERIPITEKVTDEHEIEMALNRLQSEPEYNRKKAHKYTNLLKFCEGKFGSELEQVIELWNTQNPDKKSSYRSVMRIRKDYAEKGMDALVANYGKTKNQTRSIDSLGQIGIDAYKTFESLYLEQGARSVHSCWMVVHGKAKEVWAATHEGDVTDFDEIFPCGETFVRALEKNKGISAIYRARYGEHSWNKKFGNFINRDYTNTKAGDVWVSDHRQLDQLWCMPDGSLIRPWMTAWVCFKTQKVLSYSIHADAPRADHVIDTFVSAVETWGVPHDIYIDNGKDYRCLDFAGGRKQIKVVIDEQHTRSLMSTLGVEVHFAAPYNAQAKIIERIFLVFKEWLDKAAKGYTGGNHVERPEILETQIKRGQIMKFDKGAEVLKFFVDSVLHTQKSVGKVHLGRTRDEAFFAEFTGLPKVSEDSLALLRARNSEIRTIGANGIKERQLQDYYWAEWMEIRKGTKIYLRRSMNSMQKAWVFDAQTDEYLGAAQLGMWNAPALAKTNLEHQVLSDVLRRKKTTLKALRVLAKANEAPDVLEQMKAAAYSGVQTNTTIPQSNVIKYTKYDDVARADERLASTGTDDSLPYTNTIPEKKPTKIYKFFESE